MEYLMIVPQNVHEERSSSVDVPSNAAGLLNFVHNL